MAGFEVRGSQELAHLATRLKQEADGRLRRELLAGIRTSVKKAIPDVEASARTTLPRRGGLAERVASQKFVPRSSLLGSGARVSLRGQGMKELKTLDEGRVRHPVWGNRSRWKAQPVRPHFFTRPMLLRAPLIRRDLKVVMSAVANKIARRL